MSIVYVQIPTFDRLSTMWRRRRCIYSGSSGLRSQSLCEIAFAFCGHWISMVDQFISIGGWWWERHLYIWTHVYKSVTKYWITVEALQWVRVCWREYVSIPWGPEYDPIMYIFVRLYNVIDCWEPYLRCTFIKAANNGVNISCLCSLGYCVTNVDYLRTIFRNNIFDGDHFQIS